MVSPKKLISMARKWQRVAAFSRKFSLAQTDACPDSATCSSTSVASKGHFAVYSMDLKRFMVPLAYLESRIFVELFKISEDEFGLPSDGPITMPCDAAFMEYVLSLIRRRGSKAADGELLDSLYKHHHSPLPSQHVGSKQRVVYSI